MYRVLILVALCSTIVVGRSATPLEVFTSLVSAIESNYPMLEFAGWRGDEWRAEFLPRITNASSPQAAYMAMNELVCRLNDYHTRFSWPEKPRLSGPPIRIEPVLASNVNPLESIWARNRPPHQLPPIEGLQVAVIEADEHSGALPGDTIVEVNGQPVLTALSNAWPHAVGCSVAGKLRSAAGRMLLGPRDTPLELKLLRGPHRRVITLSLRPGDLPEEPRIAVREVDGIPVIRIPRWSDRGGDLVDDFDGILNKLREQPSLIIDVRNNGGGLDRIGEGVIGRFISDPVIASISFPRQVPGLTFQRTVLRALPRGPWRYEGRVAVLTDEGCASACEHFVSGMIEAGALACGTPTSGACGLIRSIDLPGGARLNVSQTFPIHTGGMPSPQTGIAPHLWAIRTAEDAASGKDTALIAALQWLKSGKPLPARLRPVAPFSAN